MDAPAKLQLFARHMDLEPAEEVDAAPAHIALPVKQAAPPCGVSQKRSELGVHMATLPGGQKRALLKTMLTTACERNCYYCPFRAGRNYRRETMKPEEMAGAFMDLHRAGIADGLFLSSGIIKGGVATQDRLLATAEILREKHRFDGYLHLKIMPGAEKVQVEEAMRLADRVSVNLEAPNSQRLQLLAPRKTFLEELLRPLQWAEEIRSSQPPPTRRGRIGRWASTVTQFVVGAVGESDLELLTTSEYLYHRLRLRRTYFSAFRPISDTPLAELPPEDPMRQHRLYQSSFLMRDYGFDMEEMPFDAGGNLPLDLDPKLAWARHNLLEAPVELNRAGREELLRIPGVGPRGAANILQARRHNRLRDLESVRKAGVVTTRMAPYVLLDGRRPPHQPRLFD